MGLTAQSSRPASGGRLTSPVRPHVRPFRTHSCCVRLRRHSGHLAFQALALGQSYRHLSHHLSTRDLGAVTDLFLVSAGHGANHFAPQHRCPSLKQSHIWQGVARLPSCPRAVHALRWYLLRHSAASGLAQCGLTIRSSRSRFAARLNSGVRRKNWLLPKILLSGCLTTSK